jgi:hypothetical protein
MDATTIQWVQLGTTLVFGLSAVVIAGMQWLTNRNKLRIDLFQHRYQLYLKTTNFLRVTSQVAPRRLG